MMFKASKWLRTLRAKAQYREAVWEVSSHKDINNNRTVWIRIQTYDSVKGQEWQYLEMSPAIANDLGLQLQHVADGQLTHPAT